MRTVALLAAVIGVCAVGCGDGNDNREARATPTPTSPTATASPTPIGDLVVDGVYDATVVRGGASTDSIGTVTRQQDGRVSISVALGNDAAASLTGQLADDGSLSGEGSVSVTDVVFGAAGHAALRDDGGVRTITGSVTAPQASDGFNDTITFTMQRPADADASALSGPYRFEFSASPSGCGCPSNLELPLTIGPSGNGRTGAGIELGAGGTVITSVAEGFVSLSPQGRVRISLGYFPTRRPAFEGTLALIGTVQVSDGVATASGDAFVGFTPDLHIGTWTAERLP